MSHLPQAMVGFVEAAAGMGDSPELAANSGFQYRDWIVRILEWTRKGGTITVERGDTKYQCSAGGLDWLGEFASRICDPGEWDWPAPGQWPTKFRWVPEQNEFVVDPPKELVAVANTPRKK